MTDLYVKTRRDLAGAHKSGALDYYDPAIKVYGYAIGSPKVMVTEPVTDRELKILKRLELYSGDGCGDYGMIARRHLKASADAMQLLWFKGLVDGSGLPDKHGRGNTPDSSIWGITKAGLAALKGVSA